MPAGAHAHARFLDIVRDDERVVWDGPFHVGLEQWRAQRRDLASVAFTVVDLETRGGTPGFTKITEIGAVRVEGGMQVATFSQLVDPRQPIPAKITEITGISPAMLVGCPPIEEVLPRFLEFSADSVLVAHNARFDLGFLDYELSMLMSRTFPRPTLDTLRLARRLLTPQRARWRPSPSASTRPSSPATGRSTTRSPRPSICCCCWPACRSRA